MPDLRLSIAIGDYDRVRPLMDGAVKIDGVDPVFLPLVPEEVFFGAFRHESYDICELSLSTYLVKTAAGDCPYVGIPVFPSRAFRHNAFYIRTDRGIARPEDLRGRRIGLPEYQLTANVWARAILLSEYGVEPSEIRWVRGGEEQPGRVEKVALSLPAGIEIEDAPPGATLSAMLAEGSLDGLIGPRAPSCFERGDPHVGWLFADPAAAAADWYRRRRIFPIMHLMGVRRELVDRHPWLPVAIAKAFDRARALTIARLADPGAPQVTLPFLDESVHAARRLMGRNYWPYGLDDNRATLTFFAEHHHRQGLSPRLVVVEEIFHPATAEFFKI
jgi:4,5-dihydroxyphthalate decarboxylase